MQKLLSYGAVACLAAAAFAGGAIESAPATAAGPCLFGHVDPNNESSACRGSDSARFPEVPADKHGNPRGACNAYHDGERVKTVDQYSNVYYWICRHVSPVFEDDYWEWTEIVGS